MTPTKTCCGESESKQLEWGRVCKDLDHPSCVPDSGQYGGRDRSIAPQTNKEGTVCSAASLCSSPVLSLYSS
jgi:hypothetical protein